MALLMSAYFWLSLHYSLISLAFLVTTNRKYGKGGFVIYWQLNFVTQGTSDKQQYPDETVALGLVMEFVYLLAGPFFPFFLLFWVIINVSRRVIRRA
jgi:hypothetical protein